MNWQELVEFAQLIGWVENAHRKERTRIDATLDRELFEAVAQRFPPVENTQLVKLLPSETNLTTDLTSSGRFILLRQIDKGVRLQPALTFKTSTANNHFVARVYIALAFLSGNPAAQTPR